MLPMRWFEGALFEFGLALHLRSNSRHRKKAERRSVQSTLALMKSVTFWELTNEAWETMSVAQAGLMARSS
jgi:hypothetical protein